MSTKETLPTKIRPMTAIEACYNNALKLVVKQSANIETLTRLLDAAEKELGKAKERLSELSKGTLMVENARLRLANAELVKRLELIRQSMSVGSDGRLELDDEEKFMVAIDAAVAKGTQ